MRLKDNPFYILDVPLSANRRRIAEATEEMGFMLGTDVCSEAQSILTNPTKRLQAELDWFPETDSEAISTIRDSISNDQPINGYMFLGCSKLNALIHNFGITSYSTIYELGFDLVAIDKQYTATVVSSLTSSINTERDKAGFATVTENDVQDNLRKKIEDFRKLVNEKTKGYDEKEYVSFVTIIAEQYIVDKRYETGEILFDVVNQYEIRMQSALDERTSQIKRYIETIKTEQNEEIIKKSIPKLIDKVKEWDKYAQPLQLRSQATGMPHNTSQDLATDIRNLCLYLNNEKKLTSEAKLLASEMRSVFLELGELKEIFTDDAKTLEKIEKDQKNADRFTLVVEKIKEIKESSIANYIQEWDAESFKWEVSRTNKMIMETDFDSDTRLQLRKMLCYTAREKAIEMNNRLHFPEGALRIIEYLLPIFSDIDELNQKLTTDRNQLQQNSQPSHTSSSSRISSVSSKKKNNNKGCLVYALILLAIIVTVAVIPKGTKKSTKSSSSYSGSSYTSTSKSTTKPTEKPTAKPTTNTEKKYSILSNNGDKVYIDVVSIEPESAFYTRRESNNKTYLTTAAPSYTEYICKSKTTDGKEVWVAIYASDYWENIDSTIDQRVKSSSGKFNGNVVYYAPAARIHGTLRYADTVFGSRENDTGASMIVVLDSIDIPEQGIALNEYNVENYFNIDLEGKSFDSKKGLTLSYSISPVVSSYATKAGSDAEIVIKLKLKAYKMKGSTVADKTKDYTIILKKNEGYKRSGTIDFSFVMNVDSVYWGYEVVNVEGMLGK